jgi:Catalase
MSENLTVDSELGEVLQKNEEQLTQQIAAVQRDGIHLQDQGEKRAALRNVHPRAHGCVRAEFRVEGHLPPHLAQGVFVPGRRYPAWIRFSNSFPDAAQPDAKGDIRGMAIKLLDVPGDKILPEERDAQTQDFVLVSSPVFFVDDAARFLTFARRIGSSSKLTQATALLALDFRGLRNVIAMQAKIASPLETRYWSAVPYRLGDPPHKQAIKFSARPWLPATSTIPTNPAPNFLRETMIKQLAAGEARFDFLVQPRTSPAMSVESTMVEWKESEAPFFKVATISIPQQQFATPERDKFGENLSFTAWHALPQHRPLGAINRVRRVAYEAVSKRRHELNETPRREPIARNTEGMAVE